MNRFVTLQTMLRDLLAAHTYFAGAPILTEELANLEAQVEQNMINTGGFGVVITTARGQRHGDAEIAPLILTEELSVTIIHVPLMDAAHTALDALDAAITAIENENQQLLKTTGFMPWRILSHDYLEDKESGAVSHMLRVSTLMV
jgi:hypothetical protein